MGKAVTTRMMQRRAPLILILAAVLAGCASTRQGAPVIERAPLPAVSSKKAGPAAGATASGLYTVKQGDTLYSIALDHGLDYKELARINGISDPTQIRVGQQLKLSQAAAPTPAPAPPGAAPGVVTAPLNLPSGVEGKPLGVTSAIKTEPKALKLPYSEQALAQLQAPPSAGQGTGASAVPQPGAGATAEGAGLQLDWAWPTAGKVVSGFSDSTKGVDIAGKMGQPVYASAAGKVVYSGSGLRGYGKLIIIKHNKAYLSAYAHNSEILVKEGQTVAKGQKIAEMGNTDADRVVLHFEIRRFGKPVDPLKYLPATNPDEQRRLSAGG